MTTDGWQPIETAPRDGTWIAVWCGDDSMPDVASWRGGRWMTIANTLDWFEWGYDEWPIVYWMPLPPPPQEDAR